MKNLLLHFMHAVGFFVSDTKGFTDDFGNDPLHLRETFFLEKFDDLNGVIGVQVLGIIIPLMSSCCKSNLHLFWFML